MLKSNFVIINGFDRCGSSAISRTLNNHLDIELIMQPFNSGSIRSKMNLILDEENVSKEDIDFFNGLSKNYLDNSYIKSEWHKKYSSTNKYLPNKIHIVKTTINHFAQEWMNEVYRAIDVWGIWRDPFEIMNSLLINEYDKDWYKGAINQLDLNIRRDDELMRNFNPFFKLDLNRAQELALIFSVRSYFFFNHLKNDNIIHYSNFRINPTEELSTFLERYHLKRMNFNDISIEDLNIKGVSLKKKGLIEELKNDSMINDILNPLYQLKNEKSR